MITKAISFEDEIRDFLGRKHGILYERAWLSMVTERQTLVGERESVKATSRNLGRLLKSRLKQRFKK